MFEEGGGAIGEIGGTKNGGLVVVMALTRVSVVENGSDEGEEGD